MLWDLDNSMFVPSSRSVRLIGLMLNVQREHECHHLIISALN